MAAPASRKRPAQDEACPEKTHKKKRALFHNRYRFVSIYDYEMLEEIGEGAHGVVAKAQNVRTGATVAIKWIRGEADDDDAQTILHAFTREFGCLAAHRSHPGVVQLKNVARDAETGDLYIVMELGGPSLRSRLTTTRRPFTEDEARGAMRQLLEAVEKLHAAGTTHNDINPDNILVGRDGTLKICGFGCATPARSVGNGKVKPHLGTLQYRSPEQLNRGESSGPKDDMWALGCVMAELVTGEPLITAATEEDALDAAVGVRDDIVTMEEEAFDGMGMGDLSLAGRQLLAGLLAFHSCERLTAADALKHRWFTEDEPAAEHPVSVEAVEPLLPES